MGGLTPTEKGAIAELAIAYHAARLGIVALRPMVEGRRYDLVLDTGDRLWRVQCKWGRVSNRVIVAPTGTCRHTPNGYPRTTYSASEIDGIAAYCAETEARYFVPIGELEGKRALYLRLEPAANNQRAYVKMATDYPLGAIAQLGERLHGMQEVAGSSPASSIDDPR
jgi:hypothetical protein